MELAIPLTKFIPSHVVFQSPRIGSFRRTIPFAYHDSQVQASSLILVLQPMKVLEYDESRNHLVLEDTKKSSSFSKLEALQESTQNALETNIRSWLDGAAPPRDYPDIQPLVRQKRITLHLSSQKEMMPYFVDGEKIDLSPETLKPGDFVRVVVKLQGLSLQMTADDIWTGKSRIQHHVLQIYKTRPD